MINFTQIWTITTPITTNLETEITLKEAITKMIDQEMEDIKMIEIIEIGHLIEPSEGEAEECEEEIVEAIVEEEEISEEMVLDTWVLTEIGQVKEEMDQESEITTILTAINSHLRCKSRTLKKSRKIFTL